MSDPEVRIHIALDSYENGPLSYMNVSENGIYIQVSGSEHFSSGQASHLLTLVNNRQSWSSEPAQFDIPAHGDEVYVTVTVPHLVFFTRTVIYVASRKRLFDALNVLSIPG